MAEHEIWKRVSLRKGYQVSNLGRVRSIDRRILNSLGVHCLYHSKILKHQKGPNGYATVNLGKKYMTRYVHHLVMKAFRGKTPKGKEILHIDGNKKNSRLDNLKFGTRWENMQDVVRHRYEQAWYDHAKNSNTQARPRGVV